MGPVVTRGQQAAAFDGIRRLAGEATVVRGRGGAQYRQHRQEQVRVRGPDLAQGWKDPGSGKGRARGRGVRSAATIVPYRNEQDACALIAREGLAGSPRSMARTRIGPHRERRDRTRPWSDPCGRSGDRRRPYRPRYRYAAMQSRRTGPGRRGRGAWRALRPAVLSPAAGGAGLERSTRRPAGEGCKSALAIYGSRRSCSAKKSSARSIVCIRGRVGRHVLAAPARVVEPVGGTLVETNFDVGPSVRGFPTSAAHRCGDTSSAVPMKMRTGA